MSTVSPAWSSVSVSRPSVSGVSSTTSTVFRRIVSSRIFLQSFDNLHVLLQVEVADQCSQPRGQHLVAGILGFDLTQFCLDAAHVADASKLIQIFHMMARAAGKTSDLA